MKMMNKIMVGTVLVTSLLTIGGCSTDAEVASYNASKAADSFEINRRIVFYNGITDSYLLTIEGYCSIKDQGSQLEVVCKVGNPNKIKKHFLGLSDNVTYFAEQLESKSVSTYHHKIIFKPQSIIPDIDLKTSLTD